MRPRDGRSVIGAVTVFRVKCPCPNPNPNGAAGATLHHYTASLQLHSYIIVLVTKISALNSLITRIQIVLERR
jgi:hypothetical protein